MVSSTTAASSCGQSRCRRTQFSSITCDRCHKQFCPDHGPVTSHVCLIPDPSNTSTGERDASLLSIGRKCSARSCHVVDFLPVQCPHCTTWFCSSHFLPMEHSCAKFDRRMDPAALQAARANRNPYSNLRATASSPNLSRCTHPSCGSVSLSLERCDKCLQQFCTLHSTRINHKCIPDPPPMPKVPEVLPIPELVPPVKEIALQKAQADIPKPLFPDSSKITLKPSPRQKPKKLELSVKEVSAIKEPAAVESISVKAPEAVAPAMPPTPPPPPPPKENANAQLKPVFQTPAAARSTPTLRRHRAAYNVPLSELPPLSLNATEPPAENEPATGNQRNKGPLLPLTMRRKNAATNGKKSGLQCIIM